AVPRLVTQGRRQREEELAWRGEQYVRAIKLYYRKYGKFPRTVEDFSKNPGNLHFLRKEYKDPMNESDGTWRFIYMGPGGQLIGSLTRKLPIGIVAFPVAGGGLGNAAAGGTGAGAGVGFGASPPGGSAFGTGQGTGQNPQGQPPNQPTTADTTSSSGDPSGEGAPLPPAPVAPKSADAGATTSDTVFGGQLVGVGSKVDRKSIRFYKGYGKYREWEFIWDPAEEAAAEAGAVLPQQGLLPTTPGAPATPPANPQGSTPQQ
ncbi:MAG TPA: hypothetical protein VKG84_07765, partial [Candidatus Acidoferrales bacterium]|nr:hypothetical protein [Candidatus Acidoferrales bacterium]